MKNLVSLHYKRDGALVFGSLVDRKNSVGLPAGHKNEFHLYRKWKAGDNNQNNAHSMLRRHKAQFDVMK